MNASAALNSYNLVRHQAGVEGASPHQLIQMLFDGLLERIAQAKGAIAQRQFEVKSQKISAAINIVGGLRGFLDHENGGELASHLEGLYDYLQRTLWQASLKNEPALLDECGKLVGQISSAWREIA